MARIIDKDTRLIDLDFGPVTTSIQRLPNARFPDGASGNQATFSGDGELQLIRQDRLNTFAGSFIQFQRLDLSFMTQNNEVMQPVEVSVQRTSSIPVGTHENGNNFGIMQEYIFVLSRPLNNNEIVDVGINPYIVFDTIGLDRGSPQFGGIDAGGVSHQQNIYAEKRIYSFSLEQAATQQNGEVTNGDPVTNTYFSSPRLMDVNTWGSMSTITGPNLYAYRIVFIEPQAFPASSWVNVAFGGFTTLEFPPVNITFLCKDPNFTKGEYLTRLANAMNSIPEDGPTA